MSVTLKERLARLITRIPPSLDEVIDAYTESVTADAYAAAAALCREAGCAKLPGCQTWLAPESHPMGYGYPLKEHDPRCPEALAARIEALGGKP